MSRRRRIPFVPQTAATDCGAACLVMTLAAHGKRVALDDVRQLAGSSRLGLDAKSLVDTATRFGLTGSGVEIREPKELSFLAPGSILHWQFNHFVVLERRERKGAWIIDPAAGRRFVADAELDRALTGVALTFEPGASFTPGGEKAPLLRRYVKRVFAEQHSLAAILTSSLLLQVMALTVPLLTGLLVDRVLPRADVSLLWMLAGGGLVIAAFTLATTLLRSHLLLALRTRLDARLTHDFLEHLVHLPFAFFQRRSAGDLLMRLSSNATIREILTSGVLSGALDGLMVVLTLGLLLASHPGLGLLALGLGLTRLAVLLAAAQSRRRLTSEALEAQAASQSYQVQLLAGIEALKATGAEGRAVSTWSRLFLRELNASLARGRLDAWVNALLDALALASPLLVLLYGGTRVLAGELTLGTMLALAALAGSFLAPLSALVGNASQLQLLGSYLERLDDVLATPKEPDGEDRPRPRVAQGAVALERVTFTYGPLVPPAVAEVSFEVKPGQLVALVGASGSGKSTLAGLIAGLLQPAEGRLLFDGRPFSELPKAWLRAELAYVPQHSYLFGASVRANIALSDPTLPKSRITEAARLAEIDDDITRLPMGYDTVLADGGASLSGGQRQRLALARALIGRPRVLILDEATSALDALTEAKIQAHLARLEATRIVAAHRLSTVRDADLILVLDRGKIADSGTHAELAARPGIYRDLISAQLGADEPDTELSSTSTREAARSARRSLPRIS